AGAGRAGTQRPRRVDPQEAAPAGADGVHRDRGGAERQAADRGLGGQSGLAALDKAHVGGGAAHVEGDEVAQARRPGDHDGTRNAGETSLDNDTRTPGERSRAIEAILRSCAGLAKEKSRQTAIDSAPASSSAATTSRAAASSRGVRISPEGPTRSGTPAARARGTSGSGRFAHRSYSDGRCWRPMTSRSANPSVVTRAVTAPRRSSTALVATVVPWAIDETEAAPARLNASRRPRSKPSLWSSGVVGTLQTTNSSAVATTTS